MIVNSYAVIDLVFCVVRIGLALLAVGLAVSAWRTWHTSRSFAIRGAAFENRVHLLSLTAVILVVLNVLSWPLFYLLLQSYVPEWPGVMCVYGVTRIGEGSYGPARHLPRMVQLLEIGKPMLVFLSGAWLVLHLINRSTATAPLTGRVLALMLASSLVAASDAGVEVAYLTTPKQEKSLASGCCTSSRDAEARGMRFVSSLWKNESNERIFYWSYYGFNSAFVCVLGLANSRRMLSARWIAALLIAMIATAIVNAVFLIAVAAPRLNGLPGHHCPYDLAERAPESLVAIGLFVLSCFAVGWAVLARVLAVDAESYGAASPWIRRLLQLAFFGCAGSMILLSAELALS